MKSLQRWRGWGEQMRDRARARAFLHLLWRRVSSGDLFEAAASLSFTTLLALVPLSMVVFGALSVSPVFERWSDRLSDYIFSNFVPESARAVEGYLRQLSANIGQLTAAGSIALVASLLVTLHSVEGVFNKIWRVSSARPKLSRFLVYWTVLTLGALIAAASLALSTELFALTIFETAPGHLLQTWLLRAAPVVIELLGFAAMFKLVPHRSVKWRHALIGALLSVLLFELVKQGIGIYLGRFNSYQKIYGPLAVVPITMLWIYLTWVAVLLGASLASTVAAFRYRPQASRMPAGFEIHGLLCLLGRFAQARREGQGLDTEQLLAQEPGLSDGFVQWALARLDAIGVLAKAESGQWLLARDLETVRLGELYEACQLRVPACQVPSLGRDDPLGIAVADAVRRLQLPLQPMLQRPISEWLQSQSGVGR